MTDQKTPSPPPSEGATVAWDEPPTEREQRLIDTLREARDQIVKLRDEVIRLDPLSGKRPPVPADMATHSTLLADLGVEDDVTSPPGVVLDVFVSADRVFLSIAHYSEDGKSRTVTTVAEVAVGVHALLDALLAQMGVERATLALPWPERRTR